MAGEWRSHTVKVAEVVFFLSFINWKIDTIGDVYPIVDLLLQLLLVLAFLFEIVHFYVGSPILSLYCFSIFLEN